MYQKTNELAQLTNDFSDNRVRTAMGNLEGQVLQLHFQGLEIKAMEFKNWSWKVTESDLCSTN